MEVLAALIGGILFRWRGSSNKWKAYFPRPINQMVFAFPYAVAAGFVHWGLFPLVWALTTLAVLAGRGNSQDMGSSERGKDHETLEFLVRWLHGRIPERLYDFIAMGVYGMMISLPAGIVTTSPLLAFSGILMAPAYLAGRLMYEKLPKVLKTNWKGGQYHGIKGLPQHLDLPTEIGEFLTGFFLWGMLAVCW